MYLEISYRSVGKNYADSILDVQKWSTIVHQRRKWSNTYLLSNMKFYSATLWYVNIIETEFHNEMTFSGKVEVDLDESGLLLDANGS